MTPLKKHTSSDVNSPSTSSLKNNRLCLHIFLFSALIGILQLFQSELLFQRDAINNGQLWLILTGNLVHTNGYHLVMNVAGLAFICLLFRDYVSPRLFYLSLIVTMMCVGLGLYLYSPKLIWYVGLSGALYGLYIVAATRATLHKDYLIGLPLLLILPIKLFWDSQNPSLTHSSEALIGAPVATDAHIYGLVAGFIISLVITVHFYTTKR